MRAWNCVLLHEPVSLGRRMGTSSVQAGHTWRGSPSSFLQPSLLESIVMVRAREHFFFILRHFRILQFPIG